MLDAHDEIRDRAGLPPLRWSAELEAYAARRAATLIQTGAFTHERNTPYGENLYEVTGRPAAPEEVVQAWASEAPLYDRARNRCRGVCGHYTQLVWRETLRVGCASAARGRREVWVCNYDPPGNYVGERPY